MKAVKLKISLNGMEYYGRYFTVRYYTYNNTSVDSTSLFCIYIPAGYGDAIPRYYKVVYGISYLYVYLQQTARDV